MFLNQNRSQSLFDLPTNPTKEQVSQSTHKSQQFRLEIRKKQKDTYFKSVRKDLMQSLKNLNFLNELKEEKDNLTVKKIEWIVDGLQSGKNNASFYQQINDMKLQPYLCDVILNSQIALQDKVKILHSLVQLTYFTAIIPDAFIDSSSNLIDFFIKNLKCVSMTDELGNDLVYYISSLIQNLTWFQNKEFNYHMIDSDLLPVLQKLIDSASNSVNNASLVRQNMLRTYGSLFITNPNQQKYIFKIISRILSDERNFEEVTTLIQVLNCLIHSLNSQWIWRQWLLSQQCLDSSIITQRIDFIGSIIATQNNFNQKLFVKHIVFLTDLSDVNQQFFETLVETLPKKFILNSMRCMRQKQSQSSQTKRSICKTVKFLYKVPFSLRQIVYSGPLEEEQFLEILLANYILLNSNYGKYGICVLAKMLKYDKYMIDKFIERNIIEVIKDFLNYEFYEEEKINIIDLSMNLIQAEEELRQKSQGSENKIIIAFHNKGIVKEIQQLQNHQNRQIYKKAQHFMEKLKQLSNK